MISLPKSRPVPMNAASWEPPHDEPPPQASVPLSESILGFFTSVIVHTLLLLFLAVFVFSHSSEPEQIEILDAQFDEAELKSHSIKEVESANLMAASDDTDSSKIQEDVRELANASEPPPVRAAFLANRGVLPADVAGSGNGWGGNALAGLGEEAGSGQIAGNSDGEKGDGEVGFFGTKAKGKSFVFIVDCSGSMTTPTGDFHPRLQTPITRFLRARQELYLTLSQLGRSQTFYIIFYNHETYPMFFPQSAHSLVPATPNNLGLARAWIQNVVPRGGTDPRDAFKLALALRPEVIFFLTDGIIPHATRNVAKDNNKSRTRIHTIALGIQHHQEILKAIAYDNQGRFRFVP